MKVGDLVQFARHLGVIIQANDDATLIRWFEDGSIESVENYKYVSLKVISASRRSGKNYSRWNRRAQWFGVLDY